MYLKNKYYEHLSFDKWIFYTREKLFLICLLNNMNSTENSPTVKTIVK